MKTLRWSAPLALLLVAILYILANIAYFAAATKVEILASEQTIASIFFSNVFGSKAAQGLNILIALSAFGNLVAVLIGQSRLIRECGRCAIHFFQLRRKPIALELTHIPWQARSLALDQFLDVRSSLWDSAGSLLAQVGTYSSDDSGAPSR